MMFTYEINNEDIDYEADSEKVYEALKDILINTYTSAELVDMLIEYLNEKDFYDELKEYFEDDARDGYDRLKSRMRGEW